MLTTQNCLPVPHQCWLYTINTLFQVFIYDLRSLIVDRFFTANIMAIFSISAVVTFTLNTVTLFIIGISVAQLNMEFEKKGEMLDCKSVEQLSSSALKQMSALKRGLSPLLFLVFSTNGLQTINTAYSIVTLPEYTPLYSYISLFLKLAPTILILIYICLILDNCYQTFRALPLEFRLWDPTNPTPNNTGGY